MKISIDFDHDGPRIGAASLLKKTAVGFRGRPRDELAAILPAAIDVATVSARLDHIARAMNVGDLALAAVATSQLSSRLDQTQKAGERVFKASPDDPEHPGYPAKTPDGKGGEFRPKDTAEVGANVPTDKKARLARRRMFRGGMKGILSGKRVLRLVAENAAAVLSEAVPGLDAVITAATLADDIAAFKQMADGIADADVAIKFVEDAPVDLKSLQRGGSSENFPSFNAFKKSDFEKRFGPPEEGCDYHHLVEQGPNAGTIPASDLQSTDNIVEIPRLLHEEINSYYATPQVFEEELMAPRTYLRGRSFNEQRDYGVKTLQQFGAVR